MDYKEFDRTMAKIRIAGLWNWELQKRFIEESARSGISLETFIENYNRVKESNTGGYLEEYIDSFDEDCVTIAIYNTYKQQRGENA